MTEPLPPTPFDGTPSTPHVEPAVDPPFDLDRLRAAVWLRRRTWALCTLAGSILGMLLAVFTAPIPHASARILIDPAAVDTAVRTPFTRPSTDEVRCGGAEVADRAAATLGLGPGALLGNYRCITSSAGVLAITASGPTASEAVQRTRALVAALVAHRRDDSQRVADIQSQGLLARRARAEHELADVVGQLGVAAPGTSTVALDGRLEELLVQIGEVSRTDEELRSGLIVGAAETAVIDPPRVVPAPAIRRVGFAGVVGMVLGLGAGLGWALVAGVVRDRPVRRQDVARALNAPVLMAVHRRAGVVFGRRRLESALNAAVPAVGRLIAEVPNEVAFLEIGCHWGARHLAAQVAESPTGSRGFPRVGSLGDRSGWLTLREFGPTALLVVRAGHRSDARLRACALDLARAQVEVLGIVLVGGDPKDQTDAVADASYYEVLARRRAGLQTAATTSRPGG